MTKPLSIAAVPYLNALPLYVGLTSVLPEAQLRFLAPRDVTQALRLGEADLGLIPVAGLLDEGMDHLIALPNLGIACHGEVLSVYVGSQVPLAEVREVFLDPESRSSAALVQFLAEKFLHPEVQFIPAPPQYETLIAGTRAGLLIGDRALKFASTFAHRLDLGKAWLEATGLPFVFALWAIRKDRLTPEIVDALQLAYSLGEHKRAWLAEQWSAASDLPKDLLERYLSHHIHYVLGLPERKAVELFASRLSGAAGKIEFYEPYESRRQSLSGPAPLNL